MRPAPGTVMRFVPFVVLSLVLLLSTQPVQAQTVINGWGDNAYGQLIIPPDLSDVKAVAAGSEHSLALKNDGSVVAWGDNFYHQLDVPAGLADVTAIAAGYYHNLALKNDGTVVAWGRNNSGQANVPVGLNGVIAITAGSYHSLALKSNGTVVAWGLNNDGQATVPFGLSNVTAIAAAYYQSLALKSDGKVVAWGSDIYYNGLTYTGDLADIIAIAAGKFHNLALKSDGTVIAWGDFPDSPQLAVPPDLAGVTAIAAGNFHSLALKNDGTVAAWGSNGYGQMNVPSDLAYVNAIAAGSYHNLALKDQGWPVEILSDPSGLSFDVAGSGCRAGSYTTPKTLIWSASSSCDVSFAATQSGGEGTQYVFKSWSDDTGGASRTFEPLTQGASYTANFGTQYLLTTSATTGGSISPPTGWNDAGDVEVAAVPSEGYAFAGFSGALTGTTTPQTLVLNAPKSVTANFTLLSSLSIAPVAGQYSDVVTLSAAIATPGVSSGTIQFKLEGNVLETVPVTGPGRYTRPYTVARGAGSYSIEAVYSGEEGVTGCSSANVMTVAREDASILLSPQNPASVAVNVPGGTAGPITLTATIREVGDGSLGNISFATPVSFLLVPSVGTAPISCETVGSGGGETLQASATCRNVPVNLYDVIVTIGGDSYSGSASSVLSVYDPSLGSVSAVGNVDHNGVRAHLNVSARYLASGQVQGSMSYAEQRRAGDVTVDSISLRSLSVVGNTAVILGTAAVNGAGSYLIQVILVSNESRKGKSLFGLEVADRPDLSFPPLPLTGGNVRLP